MLGWTVLRIIRCCAFERGKFRGGICCNKNIVEIGLVLTVGNFSLLFYILLMKTTPAASSMEQVNLDHVSAKPGLLIVFFEASVTSRSCGVRKLLISYHLKKNRWLSASFAAYVD